MSDDTLTSTATQTTNNTGDHDMTTTTTNPFGDNAILDSSTEGYETYRLKPGFAARLTDDEIDALRTCVIDSMSFSTMSTSGVKGVTMSVKYVLPGERLVAAPGDRRQVVNRQAATRYGLCCGFLVVFVSKR